MHSSIWILLISTASIAFLHALAPDHWMPFSVIAKAQNWSRPKLFWVTLISGIGHVGISFVVSAIAILLGFSISKLKNIEGHRGEIALWLLVGFGIAYMLWGIKKAKKKNQAENFKKADIVAIWTIFAIFVLGPCESLVPLVFLGYSSAGWMGVLSVSLIFSLITIMMMLVQTFLAFKGIQLIKNDILHRYSHAFAGLVIALTGILVLLLGI
ncbi:MAG: hypothetical protein AB1472_06300 [Candidatus Omnitrophota bacterium]